ncbi:hypothetical protein JCM8097_006466 [Rhodosporidiobolus ruineniae]
MDLLFSVPALQARCAYFCLRSFSSPSAAPSNSAAWRLPSLTPGGLCFLWAWCGSILATSVLQVLAWPVAVVLHRWMPWLPGNDLLAVLLFYQLVASTHAIVCLCETALLGIADCYVVQYKFQSRRLSGIEAGQLSSLSRTFESACSTYYQQEKKLVPANEADKLWDEFHDFSEAACAEWDAISGVTNASVSPSTPNSSEKEVDCAEIEQDDYELPIPYIVKKLRRLATINSALGQTDRYVSLVIEQVWCRQPQQAAKVRAERFLHRAILDAVLTVKGPGARGKRGEWR